MTVDPLILLEEALGEEILRAKMLGGAPPRIAERYVLRRFLGRGARGLVIEADDERLARTVALKVSPSTGAAGDREILDEARALAKLEHPNIVRVHDVDATTILLRGAPTPIRFVSMQRVDGMTLRSWLRAEQRSHHDVVQMFVRAGEGLAAAHDARIVHRDFKPDNVLVRKDGTPQVVDFGFAIHDYSSTTSESLADVAGTDPYLAPEARLGRATPRADQYAFAISLVEALTGDPTPPEPQPRAHVDPVLWMVLRRATERDPRARYPDMHALLRELRGASRWPLGKVIGFVIVMVVGAVALSNAAVNACGRWRAADACSEAAGEWVLMSTVTQPSHDVERGTRAEYVLELEPLGDCQMRMRLRRTRDIRPNGVVHPYRPPAALPQAVVVQGEEREGVIVVHAQVRLDSSRGHPSPYEHELLLAMRGGGVEGSFTARSSRGEYTGTISGFRMGR